MHTCIPICDSFKWTHTQMPIQWTQTGACTRWIFHVLNNRAGMALKAVMEDQETQLWSVCWGGEQGQDEQALLCTTGRWKRESPRVRPGGVMELCECVCGRGLCKWGTEKQGHDDGTGEREGEKKKEMREWTEDHSRGTQQWVRDSPKWQEERNKPQHHQND